MAAVLLPNISSGNWASEGQALVTERLADGVANQSAAATGLQVLRKSDCSEQVDFF